MTGVFEMSEQIKKDWKKFKNDNSLLDDLDLDLPDDESDEGGAAGEGAGEHTIALDHPSYQLLEEKLTLAEQQAHDHWEKLVRAVAEVDNIRRRAERDVTQAHRFALEKFINTLLT